MTPHGRTSNLGVIMGRALRSAMGGAVYHVLNRANSGMCLFETHGDYAAFLRILSDAVNRVRMRLLAYCVMPNHWHLVVRPREDGDLSRFAGWLTLTHTQRWHARRGTTGAGHVYQGRFKSFPVQTDEHFLILCRYVERNPLRAGLVDRAEAWAWSSLSPRGGGQAENPPLELSDWPVERPANWAAVVNGPQTSQEEETIRTCILRGRPFGEENWQKRTAARLGLEMTMRPRGRPRTVKAQRQGE